MIKNLHRVVFFSFIFLVNGVAYAQDSAGITLESKKPSPQIENQSGSPLKFDETTPTRIIPKVEQEISSPQNLTPKKTDVKKNVNSDPIKKPIAEDKRFENAVTSDKSQYEEKKNTSIGLSAQDKIDNEYLQIIGKQFHALVNDNNFITLSDLTSDNLTLINPNQSILHVSADSKLNDLTEFLSNYKVGDKFTVEIVGKSSNYAFIYFNSNSAGLIKGGKFTIPVKISVGVFKDGDSWKIQSINQGVQLDSLLSILLTNSNNNSFVLLFILGVLVGGLSCAVMVRIKNK